MRELVSKVQTMRKEAGFEVTDHIRVSYEGGARIREVFERFAKDIAADTLSESITAQTPSGYVKEWDINGESAVLGVEKV
jgi:isoleucyl-tRNA synthetase